MSYCNQKILAVIPARGGSKGISRKNLRKIRGKTLLAYAIDCLKNVKYIDNIVLSTDDPEMAEEGLKAGVDVPFIRPDELASDTAQAIDVWKHAWLESESYYKDEFSTSVWIQPTSPLRTPKDVELTITQLIDHEDAQSAVTVHALSDHFSPEKILKEHADGTVSYYHPAAEQYSNRQSIPQYYYRNGHCYAAKKNTLMVHNKILMDPCIKILLEGKSVNIDTYDELVIAESLLSFNH